MYLLKYEEDHPPSKRNGVVDCLAQNARFEPDPKKSRGQGHRNISDLFLRSPLLSLDSLAAFLLPPENVLIGSIGNDTLEGPDTPTAIRGLAGGDDGLFGGLGNDTVETGDGDDGLFGGLFGGLGNDTVETGDGDDGLFGGLGNDTVETGDGDDVARGAGEDRIAGGEGENQFDRSRSGHARNVAKAFPEFAGLH